MVWGWCPCSGITDHSCVVGFLSLVIVCLFKTSEDCIVVMEKT